MIFTPTGKYINEKFSVNSMTLEAVKSFCYLGFEVKPSGTVKHAMNTLHDEANKANKTPFMTRELAKAIMNRSRLRNKFLKNPILVNKLNYKKQRNWCVKMLRKEKFRYYSNLRSDNICDNKKFWKTVKPFFSEINITNNKIVLIENDEIITNDVQTAKIFNDFFTNAVSLLEIKGYNTEYQINNNLDDV